MNAAVLRDKLAAGKLKLVSKQVKKSQVWKHFLEVVDVHTLSPVGHVQCKSCKAFFAYDGGKTGTSHLNRHKCKAADDTAAITSFFTETKPQVSSTVKGNLTTACVKWCAKDMRPFDVVCDDGFLKVADELIAIGAKYGSISARTVIPHPTTVSRRVSEVVNELREAVMPEIHSAMKEGRCSMTLDMWTDDYKKVAYITATAHYVSVKWELRSLVLFTSDFPPERKTGENIRKEVVRRSAKLRIDEGMLSNVVFVTDQGANMISALRPYARMSCCAHVLNTVLRNAFDDGYLAEELPDLLEQLKKVKAVVTLLKQSGLTSQLPHGVCQEICTRWNSKLAMIKSVLTQYDAIENLLNSRGNLLLEDVNKALLTEVVEFLEPFKEASDKLEQDKVVTLPLVLMYYTKLKKHLTAASTDSPEVCKLKSRTLEFLQTKMQIGELHKIATFLWPPFRHLRVLEEQERKTVHDRVRELLIDVHLRFPQRETSTDQPDNGPPAKRTFLDEFKEWHDAVETQPADSELDSYLRDSDSCEDIEKLLEWWEGQCSKYRGLSFLARKVLCIPSTSASSERNFSAAGYVLQERRTCLKPESLDNLLFLHKNM